MEGILDGFYAVQEDGCWLWMRPLNNKGYGTITIFGERWFAHRLSYELKKGKIPAGLELDHLCRRPNCINPDHLEAVTHSENVRRGLAGHSSTLRALARTHCKRGHELTEENTRVSETHRACRQCIRDRESAARSTPSPRKTILDRLTSKTEKQDNGCWIFTGFIDRSGFGHIGVGGDAKLAHRVAFAETKGPIPENMIVSHTCQNRACVNPDHLELALQPNAAKTHCKSGHELSGDNLRVVKRFPDMEDSPLRRMCLECSRLKTARHRSKVKNSKVKRVKST